MAQPLEWTPIQPNYSMAASLFNASEQGFSKVGDIFSKIGEQRQKQQELQMRAAEAQAMNQFRMQQLQQAQEQFNLDKQFEVDKLAYAEEQKNKEASVMADVLNRFSGRDFNKYNEQMNDEINNNEQLKAISKEISLLNQQNVSNASIIADADKAKKRLIYSPEDAKREKVLLNEQNKAKLMQDEALSNGFGMWDFGQDKASPELIGIQSKLHLNQDGTIDTSKGVNPDVLKQYDTITGTADKYIQQTQANNERLSLLNQTAKTIVGNIENKYKDKLANSDPFIDQEYVRDSNGTILRDEQGKPVTRSIPNAAKRLDYIRQKFGEANLPFDFNKSLEAQMLLNAQRAFYEQQKAETAAKVQMQMSFGLEKYKNDLNKESKNAKTPSQYINDGKQTYVKDETMINKASYKLRELAQRLGNNVNNEFASNVINTLLSNVHNPLISGNRGFSILPVGLGSTITPTAMQHYIDMMDNVRDKNDLSNLIKTLELGGTEDKQMAEALRSIQVKQY